MARPSEARIGKAGRLTVPVEVRRHLGLGGSDRVAFEIGDDGLVAVRRAPSLKDIVSLRGIAGSPPRPLTSREIKEIAEQERVEAFMRKRSRES